MLRISISIHWRVELMKLTELTELTEFMKLIKRLRLSMKRLCDRRRMFRRVRKGLFFFIFLPFLNGERSPRWNASSRGVFFGLHTTHNRGHMARAVLEGVGFALRSIYDRLP